MEKFIDSYGSNRKGKKVNCKNCGKNFITRINQPAIYCSRECSWKNKQKRITLKCENCQKLFERKKSSTSKSKHKINFCSINCKNIAQSIGGIKEIMPPHYGTSKKRSPKVYRNFYKRTKNLENLFCLRCGYKEFECGIDIHHKDGNSCNNSIENLIPLCAPCHRAYHEGLIDLS